MTSREVGRILGSVNITPLPGAGQTLGFLDTVEHVHIEPSAVILEVAYHNL